MGDPGFAYTAGTLWAANRGFAAPQFRPPSRHNTTPMGLFADRSKLHPGDGSH